jgi:isopentenyldiphosphate isomerase
MNMPCTPFVGAILKILQYTGVKRAAQRKLEQELGIDPKVSFFTYPELTRTKLAFLTQDVPLDCFTFLTRVHYEAPCDDQIWGEHEVDHVLIATPPRQPVLRTNSNEVKAIKWLSPQDLANWLAAVDKTSGPIPGIKEESLVVKPAVPTMPCHDKVSPWFRIISQCHLQVWWQAVLLDQAEGVPPSAAVGRLQALVEPNTIHRASDWSNTTTSAE